LDVTEADLLTETLERALRMPRSEETQRIAYRFTYHYFYSQNFPMDKVTVPQDNYFTARLNYTDARELAPGRDAQVDRLVGYILGTCALNPPPNTLRRAFGKQDEDRFFKEKRLSALIGAVQQHPDRTDLIFEVAEGMRDLGLYADGARTFSIVLQRDPEHTAALCGIADCCVQMKDYASAANAYRLALEKDPEDTRAQRGLREMEALR
jgi:tetratricopeptide (TPR) repeat protein